MIIGPADLLIKFEVRPAAQAPPLSRDCGMKNSADEEGIIPDMRPKQKRLFGSRAVQGDQDIGNVLFATGRIRRGGLVSSEICNRLAREKVSSNDAM